MRLRLLIKLLFLKTKKRHSDSPNGMSFRESSEKKLLDNKLQEAETKLTALERRHANTEHELSRMIRSFRSACNHEFSATPPGICDYGASISSEYCKVCEEGLGSYNEYALLTVTPTREEVAERKATYWQEREVIIDSGLRIRQMKQQRESARRDFSKTCKHVWAWTQGGSHCYGHEDRERYCKLCCI